MVKEGIFKTVYIEKDIDKLIKFYSNNLSCSQSNFIEILVRNYNISENPEKKLQQLENEMDKLSNKRKEIIQQLNYKKEIEDKLKENEDVFIKRIQTKINEGYSIYEIMPIAKNLALMINKPVEELLFKAGIKNATKIIEEIK